MTHAEALYQMCQNLFARYPLAVQTASGSDASRSMVLILRNGIEARFFVLSHDIEEDSSSIYLLRPWRAHGVTDIAEDDTADVPEVVANAITRGVPIPRHGSLFGWRHRDSVTALVAIYTDYEPEYPVPSWAVMPRAGIPETQWPPFTGELIFDRWFWGYYDTGSIVSLSGLVAATHDTVFWADTKAMLGWDSCIITDDIRSEHGYTLSRGGYIYYRALRDGAPAPTPDILLAARRKADLAPRFV
jgi:hypothetical protein